MIKKISFLFLFLILKTQLCFSHEILTGKVVKIKDGDTIVVLKDKQEITIRLASIDAPEKKQAFGNKAKLFTSEKIFGKTVKVVIENDQESYHRKVGEIFHDGISLNEELVAAGLAWVEPRFTKSLGLYCLQSQAKNQKKGLWIDLNPIPPWEFRKKSKSHEKIQNKTSKEDIQTIPEVR